MAEDWNAIRSEIATALGDVGFTAQVRRVSRAAGPNAWTPGSPTTTDTPVKVISGTFQFGQIDGTLIRSTDRKITVEAGQIAPTPEDKLVIGGVEHEIVAVMPLDPGGVALLYEIQVRA